MDSPYRALVKYLLGYMTKSTDLMYQSFRKVNNVVLKLPKIFIAVVLQNYIIIVLLYPNHPAN